MRAGGEMFGRGAELETMRSLVDEVAGGRARCVVVEGEAGIGKSRFLAEVVAMARRRGFPVIEGAADEIDRARPFGVLVDGLRAAGSDIVLLSDASQYAQQELVLGKVEEVVGGGPTLVVVDDAQWADPPTVAAVAGMGRRLDGLPLLMVLAARPVPRVAELETVVRRPGVIRLRLGPLDESAGRALARSRGRADADALVRRAGGNPFFIIELAAAGDPGDDLPRDVAQSVLDRLDCLGPDTRAVVQVSSVLGSAFTLADLAAVHGRPAAQLLPAITEAIHAGVLGERHGRIVFRHDLVRDATYQSVPHAARSALHRDAGRALAAAGASAGRVAAEYQMAAQPGDAEAIEWLRRAAAESARTPAIAVQHLEQALALARAGDPARSAVLHDLVLALELAGRLIESETLCRASLTEIHDGPTAAALRVVLVHLLMLQARGQDAIDEAAVPLPAPGDARQSALVDAFRAMALAFTGDVRGAEAAASDVAARSVGCADAAAGFAEITLSVAVRFQGRVTEALEHAERAVAIAAEARDPMLDRDDPEYFRLICLIESGRLGDCADSITRGRAGAERLGLIWNLPGYQYMAARRLLLLGEWDDAAAELDAAVALNLDVKSPDLPPTLGFRARLLARRGDLDGAKASLQEADEVRGRTGSIMGLDHATAVRALLRQAQGHPDPYRHVDGFWMLLENLGITGNRADYAVEFVRNLVSRGDTERAVQVASQMTALADRSGSALHSAVGQHCAALVAGDVSQLVMAGDAFRALGTPVLEAAAHEDAGGLLSTTQPDEARSRYERALETYEHVGAALDLARVVAALRKMGVRRGARGSRNRATSGWESLSPTELNVASLIGQGHTTAEVAARLYLSPHTVLTHVKHIFGKLGLSSRVELAAAVAQRPQS